MERTLEALALLLKGRLIGDGSTLIHGVNTLDAVQLGELSFADTPRRVAQGIGTQASALLVSDSVFDLGGKPGIGVPDPKLAFATLLELFHSPESPAAAGVHPSAVLGEGVRLAEGVRVCPNAVLGDRVVVGAGSVIGPCATIGDDVRIGENTRIGPNVSVYRQATIGNRVQIHAGSAIGGDGFGYVFHEGRHVKVPQVGNVIIEDDVEIGCNVCVDRATMGSTVIHQGAKIDNLVQIAHNNRIGKHAVITGLGGLCGSVTIGDYTVLGGRTTVTDHVTLGAGTQAGLCSVITKSTRPGEVVWGYPARPAKEAKLQVAALGRLPSLIKRFADLALRLARLERQAGLQAVSAPDRDNGNRLPA